MRLFAALDLSEDVRDDIAASWSSACLHLPAGEWRDVTKRNWHLTLAFYGDVCGDEPDVLAGALADVAAKTSPMELQTAGCGVFPHAVRSRVFWAGVGMQGEDAVDPQALSILPVVAVRRGMLRFANIPPNRSRFAGISRWLVPLRKSRRWLLISGRCFRRCPC